MKIFSTIFLEEDNHFALENFLYQVPKTQVSALVPIEGQKSAEPTIHRIIFDCNEKKISLFIKAYFLSYGPTIYYNVLSSEPFSDDLSIHPFSNIKLDEEETISKGDYIDHTQTTTQLLLDLIGFEKVKEKYTGVVVKEGDNIPENVASILVNNYVRNYKCSKFAEADEIIVRVKVSVLVMKNTTLAIKVSCDTKYTQDFDIHPFRFIDISKKYFTGVVPDTPAIRAIIKELCQEADFKLYTTYDSDYRSKLIANLYYFLIRANATECKAVNQILKSLSIHWS
jgi:hypothetical protein